MAIKEEVSNHTILVLALLVVLVVAGSTWLVLNRLNEVEQTTQGVSIVERNVETRIDYVSPEMAGSVGLSILPRPQEGQ